MTKPILSYEKVDAWSALVRRGSKCTGKASEHVSGCAMIVYMYSLAFIQLPKNPLANRSSNIQIIPLKEHKVPIALDPNIGKLDPLIIRNTHLLEILNEAVVVRDMRAGLARDHYIRHFTELGELVYRASLQDARTLGWVVSSNFGGGDGRAVRYRRVVLQRSVGETARARSGTTDARNRGVSNQRGERQVARLDVDISAQKVWTSIRPDGCVSAPGRMADCV
jgi:hypothetical protein